ncbi:hypothetical protein QPK87_30275 [Kamptonema cortianum]|nr:hypothetical protein [Kamptonema cortianum]
MNNDPIVAEVRKARTLILDSYHGDVVSMMKDAMKKQWQDGRKVVHLGKKASVDDTTEPRLPLTR